MPERPRVDYVFGYGSLVALREPLIAAGVALPALPGQLRGFRRLWGAAMNNWEASAAEKRYVEPGGERQPRVRVAFLDIEEAAGAGAAVNGLAVPVDAARLAEFDAREVNYDRFDLTAAFEPAAARPSPPRVYAYRATAAARARLEAGVAAGDAVVSRDYVALVRRAFAELAPGALEEFERGTEPLSLPQLELQLRYPTPPSAQLEPGPGDR